MDRRRVQGDEVVGSRSGSVPIRSIAHNPRSLRDSYDDTSELAESVRQVGVLQALGVIRYETFVTHYPEHESEVAPTDLIVIVGNRLLAAARLAELEEVPIQVFNRRGLDWLEEIPLITNIHWVPLPPLREAEAVQLLVRRHGSQDIVADRLGKSPGLRLALLELPAKLREAVSAQTLSGEDAQLISAMPTHQQQAIADAGAPYMI